MRETLKEIVYRSNVDSLQGQIERITFLAVEAVEDKNVNIASEHNNFHSMYL